MHGILFLLLKQIGLLHSTNLFMNNTDHTTLEEIQTHDPALKHTSHTHPSLHPSLYIPLYIPLSTSFSSHTSLSLHPSLHPSLYIPLSTSLSLHPSPLYIPLSTSRTHLRQHPVEQKRQANY